MANMLYATLEQFQILSLINIRLLNLDFSITNFLLINLLALLSFTSFIYLIIRIRITCKKLQITLALTLGKKLLSLYQNLGFN